MYVCTLQGSYKVLYGEALSRGLTLLYIILIEKVRQKWGEVSKLPWGASVRNILIKGPFNLLNVRFPYPSRYLNLQSLPFLKQDPGALQEPTMVPG